MSFNSTPKQRPFQNNRRCCSVIFSAFTGGFGKGGGGLAVSFERCLLSLWSGESCLTSIKCRTMGTAEVRKPMLQDPNGNTATQSTTAGHANNSLGAISSHKKKANPGLLLLLEFMKGSRYQGQQALNVLTELQWFPECLQFGANHHLLPLQI